MTTGTNSGNEVTLGLCYRLTAFSTAAICESAPRARNRVLPTSVGVDRRMCQNSQGTNGSPRPLWLRPVSRSVMRQLLAPSQGKGDRAASSPLDAGSPCSLPGALKAKGPERLTDCFKGVLASAWDASRSRGGGCPTVVVEAHGAEGRGWGQAWRTCGRRSNKLVGAWERPRGPQRRPGVSQQGTAGPRCRPM